MMTLDEAIEHAEWCTKEVCGECAEEHEQLAEWLRELRRARMEIDLLKILRDGFKADAQKYKAENAKLRKLVSHLMYVKPVEVTAIAHNGKLLRFDEMLAEVGMRFEAE